MQMLEYNVRSYTHAILLLLAGSGLRLDPFKYYVRFLKRCIVVCKQSWSGNKTIPVILKQSVSVISTTPEFFFWLQTLDVTTKRFPVYANVDVQIDALLCVE